MNKNCKECDKKKNHKCSCSKNFPSSVIEINNPPEIVLFHKVVIPVSLGDETQTPPSIGKYCNVLLVYEANGHAYLYSSDGIPTQLTAENGGVDDFNLLLNRPKYNGMPMDGNTDIPNVSDDIADLTTEIANLNTEVASISTGVEGLVNGKQDKLTAGANITIDDNNVISANSENLLEITTVASGTETNGVTPITWSSQNTFAELSDNGVRYGLMVDGVYTPASMLLFSQGSGSIPDSIVIHSVFTDFGSYHDKADYPISYVRETILDVDDTGKSGTGKIFYNEINYTMTKWVNCPNGIVDYSAGTAPLDGWEVMECFGFTPGKKLILRDGGDLFKSFEVIGYTDGKMYAIGYSKIYEITVTGRKANNNAAWTVEEYPLQKTTLTSTDPGEGQPLAANHFIGVYDA